MPIVMVSAVEYSRSDEVKTVEPALALALAEVAPRGPCVAEMGDKMPASGAMVVCPSPRCAC